MIKTGLFSVAENNMDYCTLMEKAHAMGFEALELYCYDDLATADPDVARKIHDRSVELDMPISCLSVSANLESSTQKDQVERIKRYADVAAVAGAPFIHFTLFPYLSHHLEGVPLGKLVKQLAPAVRELCEYSAQKGVMCLCEGQGYYMNGIGPMEMLIEQVDHPNLGLLADLGNPACVDEDTVDFIGHFGTYIKHVHVKDFQLRHSKPDDGLPWIMTKHGRLFRIVSVGTGDIDLTRAFRLLKKLNYQGCVVLEDRFVGHEAARAADLAALKTIQAAVWNETL